MDDHFEDEVKKCNNLKQLRDTAKNTRFFQIVFHTPEFF